MDLSEYRSRRDAKGWILWLLLLTLAILAIVAAGRYAFFPGDVALARGIQALVGDSLQWARLITNSVSYPTNLVLLAAAMTLAWRWAGMRGMLILPLSYGFVWLFEARLKSLAMRPRPSPILIHVTGAPTGFSFPSGHALIYFSLFGTLAILAWHRLGSKARMLSLVLCGGILVLGGSARVALGAHWPSDILGGWLISLVWTLLLVRVLVKP